MSWSTSDRMVSTANSGIPCAWAVIFARAAVGIPGTSASTSWSIDATSSGSRVSVLRFRPAPNPGRACPSSGRASTSTYTGRSRVQSIR